MMTGCRDLVYSKTNKQTNREKNKQMKRIQPTHSESLD